MNVDSEEIQHCQQHLDVMTKMKEAADLPSKPDTVLFAPIQLKRDIPSANDHLIQLATSSPYIKWLTLPFSSIAYQPEHFLFPSNHSAVVDFINNHYSSMQAGQGISSVLMRSWSGRLPGVPPRDLLLILMLKDPFDERGEEPLLDPVNSNDQRWVLRSQLALLVTNLTASAFTESNALGRWIGEYRDIPYLARRRHH